MACSLAADRFQTGHGIHMQVEAIDNVKRMGCPASNRISKGEAAVARHDLYTRTYVFVTLRIG
jgi:hypothetical protein